MEYIDDHYHMDSRGYLTTLAAIPDYYEEQVSLGKGDSARLFGI